MVKVDKKRRTEEKANRLEGENTKKEMQIEHSSMLSGFVTFSSLPKAAIQTM